jgi:CheY-like chemotaxis protein
MVTKAQSSRNWPPLGRALIVEDDAIVAMMMSEALAAHGADPVSVCPSVTCALPELDRLKPDVLVLDVHLADCDEGWAMAELVLELNPDRPAIVFSTGSPEAIPPRIAGLGEVLAKPFTPEQLIDAIRRQGRKPGLLGRLRNIVTSR